MLATDYICGRHHFKKYTTAQVKMVSNLFFPRERKSPNLGLQFDFGWAMSNFGQDITREGQEWLFCEQNACNDGFLELKK